MRLFKYLIFLWSCHAGWSGENCTTCQPLGGCEHGSCNRAMECICDEGWKGALCHEPICNEHCVRPYGTCRV